MLHHACTMCKSDFSFAVLQLLAMGLMPGFPFKIQHSYNLPCICIFAIACCWCFFVAVLVFVVFIVFGCCCCCGCFGCCDSCCCDGSVSGLLDPLRNCIQLQPPLHLLSLLFV